VAIRTGGKNGAKFNKLQVLKLLKSHVLNSESALL